MGHDGRRRARGWRRAAGAGALIAFLVGCGAAEPEFRLTAVVPSSVAPGAVVTTFGVFPAAAEVWLEEERLAVSPVAGGLRFTVPERTVAGNRTLRVGPEGDRLVGALQVRPRVDAAEVVGSLLTVRGAGWPTTSVPSEPVLVTLGGLRVAPSVAAGALSAVLDVRAMPYGSVSLWVTVGGASSAPFTLVRAAAAVRGVVGWPAASAVAAAPSLRRPSAVVPAVPRTSLVVRHAPGALDGFAANTMAGVVSLEWSAALGASRVVFARAAEAEAARGVLQGWPGVRSVAFDALAWVGDGVTARAAVAPSSPGAGQWALPLMGVREAWARSRGEGVVVAVVDTGVRLDHPDLVGNLLPGFDFVDGDGVPADYAGHGTHVAGLVAADGVVLGTAPGASLLPVRVLEGEAGGSAFTVAQGVLWAAGLMAEPPNAHPAQVINLSLGTSGYSEVLADAVGRALAAGVLVVAASGNAGGSVAFPAALPGVVAVTALAGPVTPYQPWYANRGAGVWLTAYGGDLTQDQDGDGVLDGILSTDLGGYGLRMGTSMAAPQVAGLAALALAAGAPPSLLRDTLAGTATDLGAMGFDERFGHGLVTGRAGSVGEPRSYVVALEGAGEVVGWTVAQPDGSYALGSLPPGEGLRLMAASDEDGDGLLGEAGELTSEVLSVTLSAGETVALQPLLLAPGDGSRVVLLEARP